MRRRQTRGISKIAVLGLAILLSIGAVSVGNAAWTDTLSIYGTVTTGQWERCETGYAYGGDLATPFTELLGHGPWGWSNGPLSPGTYTWDIYAGAGQNDLSKGTLVGTLTVVYDGDAVTVTYNMDEGFTMKETHLYVDTEPLPIKPNGESTTAPGQYGNTHNLDDATTDSYEVNGFSEADIYVVAHTVVCWFDPSPS